jgi:hypothetical protein
LLDASQHHTSPVSWHFQGNEVLLLLAFVPCKHKQKNKNHILSKLSQINMLTTNFINNAPHAIILPNPTKLITAVERLAFLLCILDVLVSNINLKTGILRVSMILAHHTNSN